MVVQQQVAECLSFTQQFIINLLRGADELRASVYVRVFVKSFRKKERQMLHKESNCKNWWNLNSHYYSRISKRGDEFCITSPTVKIDGSLTLIATVESWYEATESWIPPNQTQCIKSLSLNLVWKKKFLLQRKKPKEEEDQRPKTEGRERKKRGKEEKKEGEDDGSAYDDGLRVKRGSGREMCECSNCADYQLHLDWILNQSFFREANIAWQLFSLVQSQLSKENFNNKFYYRTNFRKKELKIF